MAVKSLYVLSLAAVPTPGLMAETYLPPHHAVAIDLQNRQFNEDRARWQQEHKQKFRLVVYDIEIMKNMFSSYCPSTAATFTRLRKAIDKLCPPYHFLGPPC